MGWDQAREARTAMGAGGSIWLRLGDGEEVKMVVLGSPEHVVKPGFNPGDKPVNRFEVNVLMDDDQSVKIWDMSGTVFDDLSALHEKGKIKGCWLFLSRKGVGLETRYRIIPGDKLTAAEVEPCRAAVLHEIGQAAVNDAKADKASGNGDLSVAIVALKTAADQDGLEDAFKQAWGSLGDDDRDALQGVYNERSAAFTGGSDLPF